MPGQPANTFDLNSITVVESPAPAPGQPIPPANVIRQGRTFDVQIQFFGDTTEANYGWVWEMVRQQAQPYNITVFIESIGPGYEGVLVQTTGNPTLVPGQDNYTVNLTVPNGAPSGQPSLTAGLYRIGAVVRLPNAPRFVGYQENLLVEIAPGA